MGINRRSFNRRTAKYSYRKLFVIAAEGKKTEIHYFNFFNTQKSIIQIDCIKGNNKSSPPQVLKKMAHYLKEKDFKASDEAWLVVDKDHWTNEQLSKLYRWSKEAENHGLALSNPKFEYWLLLHFEDGKNINSSRECTERLKRHLPSYNKKVDSRTFTQEQIENAIRRAKERDTPQCNDWPRTCGNTTVYMLVQNIIESNQEEI